LPSLDASNFRVITGDAEYRNLAVDAAQPFQVIHIAVENDPPDTRSYCGFGGANQSGRGQRFEQDRVRFGLGARLNDFQHLPALRDRVVVGVKNFHLPTQLERSFSGGCRLFEVINILVGKGNEETELLQGSPPKDL
jgi:hypothetical protein